MSPAAPTIQDPAARCPACDLALRGLPVTAQFCPWCGEALPARPTAPLPPPVVQPTLGKRLGAIVREHLSDGPAPPSTAAVQPPLHSLMVLGYADAMCQLGWRYETGHGGTDRNPDEARRCYVKSAHLGNDYAQAKLADIEAGDMSTRREADQTLGPQSDVTASSSETPPAP